MRTALPRTIHSSSGNTRSTGAYGPGRGRDIVIDVTGKTLVPGFVDTHYHAQWLVPEVHPQKVWQYLVQTGGMTGPRI